MSLESHSPYAINPALAAIPITSEIEAVRNRVGKIYSFKPYTKKKVSSAVSSYTTRWTSVEQGKKHICTLQLLQEKVKGLAAVVDECLDQHWLQPQRELQQSLSEQVSALREAVRRMLDYERESVQNQTRDQENHNIEVAEAEAVRHVETEIVINETTKGHNYTTGKRTWGQKQRIRRAVENIINEEIQRRHR
ncbi:hypothetical protein V496_03293 [Pseudogymnoascus sp. VKM F-4515 (FW-2607)]|nr:hypothetical protein V496_03293 [Pseudogymnoascus sp. VKM F-4515 (FW-2607)]KFZ00509.1 hypothetical protein V498_00034 [Pseudogymnoascus sp. VKM F-4517 (FW-2822)]